MQPHSTYHLLLTTYYHPNPNPNHVHHQPLHYMCTTTHQALMNASKMLAQHLDMHVLFSSVMLKAKELMEARRRSSSR